MAETATNLQVRKNGALTRPGFGFFIHNMVFYESRLMVLRNGNSAG
jgi:hypothetical protein